MWDRTRPNWIGNSWWPCAWNCCGRSRRRRRCFRSLRWRIWTRKWLLSVPLCSVIGVWVLVYGASNSPTFRSQFDRAGSNPTRSLCCSCQIYFGRRTDHIHLHLQAKTHSRLIYLHLMIALYRLRCYIDCNSWHTPVVRMPMGTLWRFY